MKKIWSSLCIIALLSCSGQSGNKEGAIDRINSTIGKVILVNIENERRSSVAEIIAKLDSCKVKIIGINAIFDHYSQNEEDTLLLANIKRAGNVVLVSNIVDGRIVNSDSSFLRASVAQGILDYQIDDYGVYGFKNYVTFKNSVYWSFPVSVVSYSDVERGEFLLKNTVPNECYLLGDIPQIIDNEIISKGELSQMNYSDLEGRIALLGHLGPGNGDKFSIKLKDNQMQDIYSTQILRVIVLKLLAADLQVCIPQ